VTRRINPVFAYLLAAAVALGLLWLALPRSTTPGGGKLSGQLVLFCAAGMQAPIEKICQQYEDETGASLMVQYGGSNTLLSMIEVAKQGDLFLAADVNYLNLARERGLVDEIFPLGRMQAVVIVPRGNPARIKSFDDLLSAKVSLANPDQAASGKATRAALSAVGKWEALERQVQSSGVFKPTVNEVAQDVSLGSVDAGIVWDAIAKQFDDVEVIELDELKSATGEIAIGVLSTTRDPTTALRFCRYAAASDRGLPVFAETGYTPANGDPWQEVPELTLYAGAINRRALEPIVEAFAEREGVEVTTKYNGCGILNADIKGLLGSASNSSFPDAYVPCDRMYLAELGELFDERATVSSASIVIVTAKNNPKGIATLADLAAPGVRVALGQPDQCTIGRLSRRLLEQAGVYDKIVAENLATETATSSLLVPAVTTGAADAALVYITDAQAERDRLTIFPIDSPLAMAKQSFGVSRSSSQKQLASRLFEAISRSRESFEAAGFRWELSDSK
jgi:molybdate transport system substrate-binding protein